MKCSDPRHIECDREVRNKQHGVCHRCYLWLRAHGRIQTRPYVRIEGKEGGKRCDVDVR